MVFSKVTVNEPPKTGIEKITEQDNSFSNQILILFSAPLLDEELKPVEKLAIQKEIEAIALVLEQLSIPVAVEIVVKVATSETLQDVFASRVKPLIIHFIGHGTRQKHNTALILEDETGMARAFSEEELKIALSNQKQAPCQLALLNSCHSEQLAQAFVNAKVPHVIAINAEDKILDAAARCFSRRLYQALFNQNEVDNSFLSARNAVKLDDRLKNEFNSKTLELGVNFDEAFKYHLLPPVPHNQLLRIELANTHQVIYPQWLKTNLASDNPSFVGRKLEIHQVIKILVESDKRCIALHGMGGIGKTDLAKAIGRWLHERDRYGDGVWLISLRDTTSVETLIVEIQQTLELKTFALKRELRNSRLFLILDDLDGLIRNDWNELIDLLSSLLEECPNLRLLLTARDLLAWDISYFEQIEVGSMGVSETRQIFKKYAPEQAQWGDDEDLRQDFERLVQFLDGYPLAIKLAASYMKQKRCTLQTLCEKLDIEPLRILELPSPQEKKERSLRVTLELSFEVLSVEGQDRFPLLAFFPSGLSRDLAKAVWGEKGENALEELFEFSMAEQFSTASGWRVNLPEPARSYAESKLQQGRNIDYLAPLVLDFYHSNFCDRVIRLFNAGNEKKGQQLLLQENSNLILFLEWGYEQEISSDGICHSARITASLSPYWRWIEPNQDPLFRLNQAIEVAQSNRDLEGEALVKKAIATLASRGEFKTVQALSQGSDELKSFEFEVVTLNNQGQEIRRKTKQAEYFTEILDDDISLEMVSIPGGIFMMGSPNGEGYDSEKPQHQVTVQPFFMGKFPITQAQWQTVMGNNPARFQYSLLNPVERVSWDDAQEFCDRLSKLTEKEYRLPTEAEWEYACRARTTTPFHFGKTINASLANYYSEKTYEECVEGEFRKQTTPVRYFKVANAFGLYDMHGNIWEWCEDDWHKNYEDAPTDGSAWISEFSSNKAIRGGSWFTLPYTCRCASRNLFDHEIRYYNIGFRVVCVAPRTT